MHRYVKGRGVERVCTARQIELPFRVDAPSVALRAKIVHRNRGRRGSNVGIEPIDVLAGDIDPSRRQRGFEAR